MRTRSLSVSPVLSSVKPMLGFGEEGGATVVNVQEEVLFWIVVPLEIWRHSLFLSTRFNRNQENKGSGIKETIYIWKNNTSFHRHYITCCHLFLFPSFLSGGASPYYFGTTNLWCIKKGKREAPSRGTWSLSHRFIYYKGYYFEFLSKNLLNIEILPIIFYFYKSLIWWNWKTLI